MPKNPTSNENRTVWLIARQMTGKGDSQSDQMSVVVAATKQAFTICRGLVGHGIWPLQYLQGPDNRSVESG